MRANSEVAGVCVLEPHDGLILRDTDGARSDWYMIDSEDATGRFSLIEHVLRPHVLAAPLHFLPEKMSTASCSKADSGRS